jgi:RimJ/RimL family protein N-acetyltransferase
MVSMPDEVILETERLRLRMFRADDFDAYAEICADPEVMRYLGAGKPLSRPESWRHMAFIVGHWALTGYGHWAVEPRSGGPIIGRLGFFNPEGWPGFEIGWTLGRPYWGKGYATEGARAAMEHAFTTLGRDRVISVIHPENRASIRVAERLGQTFEGETTIFGVDFPVLVYGIDRARWTADRMTESNGSKMSSIPESTSA